MKRLLYKPTRNYMFFLAAALFCIVAYGIFIVMNGRYEFLLFLLLWIAALIPSMRDFELTDDALLVHYWGLAAWIKDKRVAYSDIEQVIPYYSRSGKLKGLRVNYLILNDKMADGKQRTWINIGSNINVEALYIDLLKQFA